MRLKHGFPVLVYLVLTLWVKASVITGQDALGKKVEFNPPGRVSVVISSGEKIGQSTRTTARLLDEWAGRADFRSIVLIDLRGSMGSLLPSVVRMQVRSNLRAEAQRITPFVKKNNPVAQASDWAVAVPDFEGDLSVQVGWKETADAVRVVVFNREGVAVFHWSAGQPPETLQQTVRDLLGS